MNVEALNFSMDGLLPVVVQHHRSGEVLMVGFANREAADLLRRRNVSFDQGRRNSQRAGDIVETVRGIVRWEILGLGWSGRPGPTLERRQWSGDSNNWV